MMMDGTPKANGDYPLWGSEEFIDWWESQFDNAESLHRDLSKPYPFLIAPPDLSK